MVTKKPPPEEPGTEVAVIEESNGVVEAAAGLVPRTGDVISRYVHRETEDVDAIAEAVHLSIIEEVMASRDVDSVLFVPEPEAMAEFVGRHCRLDRYKVQESEFDQGPPIYLTLSVFDMVNQTKHLINTGEQRIMAQVVRIDQLGGIPFEFTVKQASRPNRYNRFPLALTKWEGVNG
jgi:hypothetical protein